MKKLLWTVAALAALSFAVVGCNQNTDDATKTDTSTSGTTTGSTTTGTDANKTDGNTQDANNENVEDNVTEDGKLAALWVPGTSYGGTIEYEMVANGDYGNATASEVMFNIDVSGITDLKVKDTFTLEFKVTECDGAISTLGYGTALDNWAWHSTTVQDLGATYKITLDVSTLEKIADNKAGIKFVPQDSDGALIGKKLTLKVEGLKVTHVPYVAGAEKVIYETAQTESGNVDFNITADNFTEYLKDYTKIIFTLKNGGTEDRNGWGILCLISQETSGAWTWHNLKSNTTLGTDQNGQLSSASFAAGAETTMELSLQDLADAVKAEGETNRLALQTSNGALLLKITLK